MCAKSKYFLSYIVIQGSRVFPFSVDFVFDQPSCLDWRKRNFPWQEKLVAPLIATPNEDKQFEDEVTKREKGKGLRYRLQLGLRFFRLS